jgi:hypothetical protein
MGRDSLPGTSQYTLSADVMYQQRPSVRISFNAPQFWPGTAGTPEIRGMYHQSENESRCARAPKHLFPYDTIGYSGLKTCSRC